jgi:nucleotide-binding universal stress UspA family protein
MNPTITRILVPTDFGAASSVALDYAIAIARRFGASLRLLHVVDDPCATAATWGSEIYIGCGPALRDSLIDEAATKLSALLAQAEACGVAARSEVRLGWPAEVIAEAADAEAIDLIVMGTRGRKGLSHALIGSVAEKTVRESHCPVLAVHSDGRPFAAVPELFESDLAPTE